MKPFRLVRKPSLLFFVLCLSLVVRSQDRLFVFSFILDEDFPNFIVGRCLELDSGLVFKLSDLNQNGNHFEKGVEYLSIYYRPLGISGALKVKDQMTFNLRGQSYQALVSPPNILVKPLLEPVAEADVALVDTLPAFTAINLQTKDTLHISENLIKGYDFLYVSVWAHSCRPCIEDMPQFEIFETTFKKRILFIHLSSERNIEQALEVLNQVKPPGIYAVCSESVFSRLNVSGFPRGNLYDKKGKLMRSFSHITPAFNYLMAHF